MEGETTLSPSIMRSSQGGSARESPVLSEREGNPPGLLLQHPTDGFEDRGAHRDSSTPEILFRVATLLPDQVKLLSPGFWDQPADGQPVPRFREHDEQAHQHHRDVHVDRHRCQRVDHRPKTPAFDTAALR